MTLPGRTYSSPAYRYGFQGQEKDDELKGEGNSLNYTFRMHDPRVGRFFAVDPLESDYPWYTPYQFSGNRVIDMVELEGLEPIKPRKDWKPQPKLSYVDRKDLIFFTSKEKDIKTGKDKTYLIMEQDYASSDNLYSTKHFYEENGQWLPFNEKKPKTTQLAKELKQMANEIVPDAGEISIQGSIAVFDINSLSKGKFPFSTRLTYSFSIFHADDGFGAGYSLGTEVSNEIKIFSLDAVNINAFYNKEYGKELYLFDLEGVEYSFNVNIPTEAGVNVGGNYIIGHSYNGYGLSISPLSTSVGYSASGTTTTIFTPHKSEEQINQSDKEKL